MTEQEKAVARMVEKARWCTCEHPFNALEKCHNELFDNYLEMCERVQSLQNINNDLSRLLEKARTQEDPQLPPPMNPLKSFYDMMEAAFNPHDEFEHNQEIFKEGDNVEGTWVAPDGSSHYGKGTIISHGKTGLIVNDKSGFQLIKYFYTLNKILNDTTNNNR